MSKHILHISKKIFDSTTHCFKNLTNKNIRLDNSIEFFYSDNALKLNSLKNSLSAMNISQQLDTNY